MVAGRYHQGEKLAADHTAALLLTPGRKDLLAVRYP